MGSWGCGGMLQLVPGHTRSRGDARVFQEPAVYPGGSGFFLDKRVFIFLSPSY